MAYLMIETQDLTKIYGDSAPVRALDDVTLSVSSGEFLAVTGPSGSGKSTLLNLLGTLDYPTQGLIMLEGVDLAMIKGNDLADFRRENIGFVFQLFNLIPVMSAIENVMLPLIPYRRNLLFNLEERACELLEAVGLLNRTDHLPGQLSGGEQQRVAIARALINHPRIILADEPTGNVDSKTGEEIVHLLQHMNRVMGVTVVMVTHDECIATLADRTVSLLDGKLIETAV